LLKLFFCEGQTTKMSPKHYSFSEMIERDQFPVGKKDQKHSMCESIVKSGTISQPGDILGHYGNGLLGKEMSNEIATKIPSLFKIFTTGSAC